MLKISRAYKPEVAGGNPAVRGSARLSQIELAARLKTSQANIFRLEKGCSKATTSTLERIAEATGHKLGYYLHPVKQNCPFWFNGRRNSRLKDSFF